MLKIVFFVPPSHLETVKEALFDVGAGKIGNYDRCCWQILGQGQFRPLNGSQPFVGSVGSVELAQEYRVELVCEDAQVSAAIRALKHAHPYEEPAYEVYTLFHIDLDQLE